MSLSTGNSKIEKVTVEDIKSMKQSGEKIAALTAYDYLMARILDSCKIDLILVGDSAGNVIAGYGTTLPVSVEEMLYHTRAVHNGVKRALLILDMPFLSYQCGTDDAVRNAGLFLKAGAEGVKLEGGRQVAEIVERLVGFGIPVMGHLGLTPQSINVFGNYKVRGKKSDEQKRILEDAKILEQAGVFAMVLEKVPEQLAGEITKSVSVPTIGIGAGRFCDGQILVSHDILGINEDFRPKFLRKYANLAEEMRKAFGSFIKDVKGGNYPSEKESYTAS
ncbi:3-methyl-2-oxobutanoate hydroxymethyltransferase [bacterium SM23_31]|nr:MAG: 3-methyl-2-oxobutanoate hydroxymethyltransferase [bacterium SM23_31]